MYCVQTFHTICVIPYLTFIFLVRKRLLVTAGGFFPLGCKAFCFLRHLCLFNAFKIYIQVSCFQRRYNWTTWREQKQPSMQELHPQLKPKIESMEILLVFKHKLNIAIFLLFKHICKDLKRYLLSWQFALICSSNGQPRGDKLVILNLLYLLFLLKSTTLKLLIVCKLHEFNGLNYFPGCTRWLLLTLVRLRSHASKGSFQPCIWCSCGQLCSCG